MINNIILVEKIRLNEPDARRLAVKWIPADNPERKHLQQTLLRQFGHLCLPPQVIRRLEKEARQQD